MKFSTLKDLIQGFIAWLSKHKLFWMMLFYEFLFVYFLVWIMMAYSMYIFHHTPLLEIFLLSLCLLIFFNVCAGSFIMLHLLLGTPRFWKMFILLSLPAAYHLLVKSIWVLGISFFGASMRGGMVSLDITTYKREYDNYNQGSYSNNYGQMRQDYADKKLKEAQAQYDAYVQSLQNNPTPCFLIKTPVKYWKISLI
jgi:hypothetical protein